MSKIFIKDLRVRCIIGTLPEERKHRQELTINLTVETDLQRAAASDDLSDTVDYSQIERDATAIAEESGFLLIERLAGEIGRTILERYPAVTQITVAIDKPSGAAIARAVGIEMEFTR